MRTRRSPGARTEIARPEEIFVSPIIGTDREGVGIPIRDLTPGNVTIFIQDVAAGGDVTVAPMGRGWLGAAVKGVVHPGVPLSLDHIGHDRRIPVRAANF